MFWYIVVSVFFVAAQGRQIPPSQSRHCRVVNDQVDRLLKASNDDFWRKGIPQYTEGIDQGISLSVVGSSIPGKVFLKTSRGQLRSVATLSRSSNATMCTDEDRITLEGVFQFGLLDLQFNEAQSEFLLMKTAGTFCYKVRPSVNIFIIKNRNGCYLNSYSIATTDSVDYQFLPNSWTGTGVATVLQEALREADTTLLLLYVQQASQDFVKTYFTKAWCESLKIGNTIT